MYFLRLCCCADSWIGFLVLLAQVDASVKETPRESVRNLNLNLPPVSSGLTGPEIINVDPEPIVEDSHPEAASSKKMVELVKPNTDQELKFPINDSLLVGNEASSAVPTATSSSIQYPIIDLSDMTPALLSVSPAMLYTIPPPMPSAAPVTSAQQSDADLPGKKLVEEKLLRELEEMGFKQVDLNKEILRMNEYDLEQSVDDLCGVAEWDPILEELEEMVSSPKKKIKKRSYLCTFNPIFVVLLLAFPWLFNLRTYNLCLYEFLMQGFHDTEVNKMLLKKNNGSIKRVVMDLIAGEKI